MNKKGDISLEYIIIALLALIVLVVIILFFTGGMQKIFKQTVETGQVTEQQLSIWVNQCKLYCSVDKKQFCTHLFEVKNEKGEVLSKYICNANTYTGSDTGTSLDAECSTIKTQADCK
jgi:hypothetical protein